MNVLYVNSLEANNKELARQLASANVLIAEQNKLAKERQECALLTNEVIRSLNQQLVEAQQQISDLTISSDTYFAERNSARDVWRRASKDRDELRQQVTLLREEIEENKIEFDNKLAMQFRDIAHYKEQLAAALADSSTAWAQAHRLALELECLIMDTKDNAIVSKWWDSAFEAMEEYHKLKPGASEDAEAWEKIRKAGI